jgi:hypothetical protein
MGLTRNKEFYTKYEYDFDVSGGAIGNINLTWVHGEPLIAGMIVKDFTIVVESTLTGSATPTITMGHAGDRDGYAIDFFADASAGSVINVGDRAGALVWDDTNDHNIFHKIASSANASPSITIASQNLTAGKFAVYFTAIMPG